MRKENISKIVPLLLLTLLFTGCHFLNAKAGLDKEFSLRIGEEIEIEGEDLFIRFVSVPADSRCYKSLYDWYISQHVCSESGTAEILTSVRKKNRETELEFLVHGNSDEPVPADRREKVFLNYRIKLKSLSLNARNVTFLITSDRPADAVPDEEGSDDREDLKSIEFKVEMCSEGCPEVRIPQYKIRYESVFSGNRITLLNTKDPERDPVSQFPVSREDTEYFVKRIEESKFFDLGDDLKGGCDAPASAPSVEIRIGYGSKEKTVRHYLNCSQNKDLPKGLLELEAKLLEIVKLEGIIPKPEADSKPARIIKAGLNQKFKLAVGEEAKIKNQDLTIRFVSVPRDNRCPFHKQVSCAVRGEAEIVLLVKKGNKKQDLTLLDKNLSNPEEAHLRFESKDFLDYRIHLKDVPRDNHNEITLLVTRK